MNYYQTRQRMDLRTLMLQKLLRGKDNEAKQCCNNSDYMSSNIRMFRDVLWNQWDIQDNGVHCNRRIGRMEDKNIMVTRGGTTGARKKRKEDKKSKKRFEPTGGDFTKAERETLRNKEIAKGGQFAKDVQEKETKAAAKRAVDFEKAKVEVKQEGARPTPSLGEEITIENVDERKLLEKGLDVLSAPLSQPKATFTEGLGAGAEAVRKSREKIAAGDTAEAGSVILTTATTTGLLVGALLTGAGAVGTVQGLSAKLAAGIGTKAATAATVATTKASITGGVGLGVIFGIDKFVFSPNELGTWAAVDNVAGALSFQISELDNGVRDGSVSREQAVIVLEETKGTIANMRIYINRQVTRNPKLWASSKIFNAAIDTAEGRVQQIELQIFGQDPLVTQVE